MFEELDELGNLFEILGKCEMSTRQALEEENLNRDECWDVVFKILENSGHCGCNFPYFTRIQHYFIQLDRTP